MRRAVRGMEQQTTFPSCITLQVLCNLGVQIHFPLGSSSLEIFHHLRCILLNLLLDGDGSTLVCEMTAFDRKRLRNSQTSGCEQNIQRLFLSRACLDEF
jgi:hypothetical protein